MNMKADIQLSAKRFIRRMEAMERPSMPDLEMQPVFILK